MHDFTVLTLSGAYPASVATTLAVLVAARNLAPRLGIPVPSWKHVFPRRRRPGAAGRPQRDRPRISELAQAFCMSERTLARHVKRVTGKSTLALLQSVRQRRARSLLESSRMSVEQVVAAVGYQDATALRRLMRRLAGANPSRFRPAAAAASIES